MPEDKKLQFVIVKPGAKLDKTIIVPGKCFVINIHENTIYICMLEEGVCILSDNGTNQKRIPYESTGIPKYICVTPDAKRICYAGGDEKSAFVSFMTNDGYGLKKCTDGIQIPAGLSLDTENNILLLDSGANKIYVIHNNDGNKQCLLSKNAKKYTFTSMLFNIQTRKLVVACSGKTPEDKRNTRQRSIQGKEEKEKEKPVSKVKIYQLGAQPSFKRKLWKW